MLANNWWALITRGLAALLFGLVMIIFPGITLVLLVLLFGVYALVDGIFATVMAVKTKDRYTNWWSLLLEGLFGIAIGILTFLWPGITALSLLYLIAAWAIITGVFEAITAIRLREEIEHEWLLIMGGILSVIFGVLLLEFPSLGALSVITLIGFYALIFGFMYLILGLRLRAAMLRPTV